MKRLLLFALASLLMVGASAQPPQGFRAHEGPGPFRAPQGMHEFQAPKDFQGPREFKAPEGFQGPRDFKGPKGFPGARDFRGPRGPRGPQGPRDFRPEPPKDIVVVPLTDEEVAERFARRLHLDSEKAETFAPLLTAFRAELKEVEEQYPITFKPKGPRGPKAEKPTEEEIAEMKAQRAQFGERHKAEKAVEDEYKDRFFEVLNHRQYHWMFRLLRDRGMFVKFERITGEETAEEQEQPAAATRGPEGIADAIETVNSDKDEAGEWHAINGVTLKERPNRAGIYVNNGKKVLVR